MEAAIGSSLPESHASAAESATLMCAQFAWDMVTQAIWTYNRQIQLVTAQCDLRLSKQGKRRAFSAAWHPHRCFMIQHASISALSTCLMNGLQRGSLI